MDIFYCMHLLIYLIFKKIILIHVLAVFLANRFFYSASKYSVSYLKPYSPLIIPTRYPNCCHIERFKRAESVFDANFTRRHASRRVCAFSGCSIACTIYTELLFCLFIFYFILQDEIVI